MARMTLRTNLRRGQWISPLRQVFRCRSGRKTYRHVTPKGEIKRRTQREPVAT